MAGDLRYTDNDGDGCMSEEEEERGKERGKERKAEVRKGGSRVQ